jgi:hypothetical protein
VTTILFSFVLSFSFLCLQIVKSAVTLYNFKDGSRKFEITRCPSFVRLSVSELFTDNKRRVEQTEGHRSLSCCCCCLLQRHHGLSGGTSTGEAGRLEEIGSEPR